MAEPGTGRARPALYSIAAHRAFADALAAGLIARFGGTPLGLARGIVLLPNNRARRAVTDAFVRASGGGLLLPRLVAIGDPELGEASGALLDPANDSEPVPPAIDPLQRRMILARLVREERARRGQPVDAAEAVRLAGDLARTLDQLLVEEIEPQLLRGIELAEEISVHWRRSLELFEIVLDRWPAELARHGMTDGATRRARLLDRTARCWRLMPPDSFVCAAGITDTAPAVARLLRCIAGLSDGTVVLAGLDTEMPDEEWDSLGPHAPDPATGLRRRSVETHPQFHLKLLLDRMGVRREEFVTWRGAGGTDATIARGRAIANAFAPAAFTRKWTTLDAAQRRLSGIAAAELATPADEAQAIALALREVLEPNGGEAIGTRTAALVTPDRALARRVAAHCARWGIAIDDSAGRPLSLLPSGTLLTALAEAAVQHFAPAALLTLLKHPLVRFGEARGAWLDGVRRLDRALRGPRPAPGLAGLDAHLAEAPERERAVRADAMAWWPEAREMLAPLEAGFRDGEASLASLLDTLRDTAHALCGDALWSGPAGRTAADLLGNLHARAGDGPALVDAASLPALLRTLMDETAVRPPQGGHPRLAIYGLIEARLQNADLMILGGLNEGVWPAQPAPDPWLAPRIRAELGLPGLEQRIGIAAHDLVGSLGAPRAMITRSRRDAAQPAIPSRFWLRLQALAGDRFERASTLERWARELDDPGIPAPAGRPAPVPPAALRPRRIAVTDVDRLKADPYAFYAKRILRLAPLDPVDADPSAAWRGTAVHAVLEEWAKHDDADPVLLRERARLMLEDERTHPLMRALWQPRLMEAIDWIAAQIAEGAADGRRVVAVERAGGIEVDGVMLTGTFDRIDRLADGTLAVIDYKTGTPPSPAAVRAGFSLQLGLLGLIAARGGYAGVSGEVRGFEYWSLGKRNDRFGYITSPVDVTGKGGKDTPAEFMPRAAAHLANAVSRWLTGDEAFTAKLHPEFAPYGEYDQLMRRDEWYGREQ